MTFFSYRKPMFAKLDSIIKELPRNLSHKAVEDATVEFLLDAFMESLVGSVVSFVLEIPKLNISLVLYFSMFLRGTPREGRTTFKFL